jgi:hypothetical protein
MHVSRYVGLLTLVLVTGSCYRAIGADCTSDDQCSGKSNCFRRDGYATCEIRCDLTMASSAKACPDGLACVQMAGTDVGVCRVYDH